MILRIQSITTRVSSHSDILFISYIQTKHLISDIGITLPISRARLREQERKSWDSPTRAIDGKEA